MAYIGREPQIGNFQVCDAITVVDAQAAYTMQVGGVDVSPETANHMLVSLNGILQAPITSFTVSGSTITFASALETGDVIDFIQILGNVLDLGVPSDNTVSTAKIVDGAITSGKIDTTAITGQTEETSVANDDTILIADTSAGALRKMTKANFTAGLGGLSVADQWRISSDTTMATTGDFFTANWEQVDTSGQGTVGLAMTESSGVFTFPETGVYWVYFTGQLYTGTNATGSVKLGLEIHVTTNNSSYTAIADGNTWNPSNQFTYQQVDVATMIDCTDTSNVKIKFKNVNGGSNNADRIWRGATAYNHTYATFLKVGAT
jgi:hypothetical protein